MGPQVTGCNWYYKYGSVEILAADLEEAAAQAALQRPGRLKFSKFHSNTLVLLGFGKLKELEAGSELPRTLPRT